MAATNPRRARPSFQPSPEAMESRCLLTGGAGNTFAVMTAAVTTPNGTTTLPFILNPASFKAPHHHAVVGLDLVAANGSKVVPTIAAVIDSHGRHLHLTRTKGVQAVTVDLQASSTKSTNYSVIVAATGGTSGSLLLGYYLAGDANGDGKVDSTDVAAIKAALNTTSTSSTYSFDADTNRDGKVNATDLSLARRNMGVSTTVRPDISAKLDPASDTGAADRITSLSTVHFTGTTTPGAAVSYSEISSRVPTVATTADATGAYSINLPLAPGANAFNVSSTDNFGQTISGRISPVTLSSIVPPAVVAATTATKTA